MSSAAVILPPPEQVGAQDQAKNLQQAIWQELQKIQMQYTQAIQQATAAGNPADVMRLITEMNAKIVEAQSRALTVVSTENVRPNLPPVPVKRSVYDPSVCKLDLDLLAYDREQEFFFALKDDEHFSAISEQVFEHHPPANARMHLLKSSLKLSPTLAPHVFAVVNRCKEAIGLNADVEIYVTPSTDFNACCYPPEHGKFLLSFTSGLLEKFDQDELAFVMGHELGHALFKHSLLPVGMLMHYAGNAFSPIQVMKMFAWKRAAEISADRIGLICAKNFEAAGRAFFKISSGVTDNSFQTHIKEYLNQLSDLEGEMQGGEVSPEDWYTTHPFSPLRLKALDIFNRSETYQNIAGDKSKIELSEEQLEFEIKKLLSLMEPSYITDPSKSSRAMTDFLFFAGYVVAAANGVVEDSEVAALTSLLPGDIVNDRMQDVSIDKVPAIKEKLKQLAEEMDVVLAVTSKLNLIKDLTLIAGADGDVDDSEKDALYEACDLLSIKRLFVDDVLAGAARDAM